MIFLSDDEQKMGLFNGPELNSGEYHYSSDIFSENNRLFEDSNMNFYRNENEEKNFYSHQKNDLNKNDNNSINSKFKNDDEKMGDDFISRESGIYNDKVDKGMFPINQKNEDIFQEIKHNQESCDKINENEKE